MSELRRWLEQKQPTLVGSLGNAISKQSGAMQLERAQLSALVLALAVAVEQGADVLRTIVEQWEQSDQEQTDGCWSNTFIAIREELTANVISEFSPAKALKHLKVLNKLLIELSVQGDRMDYLEQIEILRGELQEVQAQLARLEQSKSDFINIAAHELKTPLTLIEGYANMLMVAVPEDARSRTDILLGGITNGTRRLQEIIEGMIDISMIDTKVLDISYQPLFFRHVTNMAVRDLSSVLRIRQITLTMDDFPEDGVPSFGDLARLYKVIYNVLGNAIKYTPDGGKVHIGHQTHPAVDDQRPGIRGHIHFQISDTGIGISSENLERVFEKFSGLGDIALHSTGKFKFMGGGPGLGLAISRGVVQAHGGEMWAESPGCDHDTCPGSTFHIRLPLWDSTPDSQPDKVKTVSRTR